MIVAISVDEVPVQDVFRNALTNRINAVAMDPSAGNRVLKAKPRSTRADTERT